MPRVTPNFHFNGQCEEAIALYARVFGGEIKVLLHDDAEKDLVYHAEMIISGHRVILSDTTDVHPPKGNNLSLIMTFETVAAVKAAFEIMSEGAKVIYPMQKTGYSDCFVSFIDRFGMRWEFMTE